MILTIFSDFRLSFLDLKIKIEEEQEELGGKERKLEQSEREGRKLMFNFLILFDKAPKPICSYKIKAQKTLPQTKENRSILSPTNYHYYIKKTLCS